MHDTTRYSPWPTPSSPKIYLRNAPLPNQPERARKRAPPLRQTTSWCTSASSTPPLRPGRRQSSYISNQTSTHISHRSIYTPTRKECGQRVDGYVQLKPHTPPKRPLLQVRDARDTHVLQRVLQPRVEVGDEFREGSLVNDVAGDACTIRNTRTTAQKRISFSSVLYRAEALSGMCTYPAQPSPHPPH